MSLTVAFLGGIQPSVHKHLLDKYNGTTIMVFTGFIYFICLSIFSFVNRDMLYGAYQKLTLCDTLWFLFLPIVTSFIANMLYYYALNENASSIVAALVYSSPIFTLFFSYYFLGERLDRYGYIGILLLVLGVIFISMNDQFYREEEFRMVMG